ncbi:Alpha-glucosides permease MPH3 [Cyphellophora attinorum]|uniref:Alpha-glucosides permease MPH3 n=1 Tax=Cyphellophora attinorum TaxID=1664694 RepID=A0A0N1HDW7_9EURO|nr:Alpha-glucosides permease MPH3 [Phialophora attinorum]KPI42790.1 Alpha-glucosides permease MPH3 [Phialophora attinorum]
MASKSPEKVDTNSRAQLAARYTEYEKSLSFFDAVKIYWRSSLYVLYGLLLAFNYGMDGVIAGYQVSVPKFREDYGKPLDTGSGYVAYIITANWLAIFSAVGQACAVVGAATAGYVADKVGRRNAAAISCVISIGGVAAQYWSNGSLGILCAGKAINGFPIGMWLVIGPLYASEVAALRLRGVLSAMTNTTILSGVFVFSGVMYHLGVLPTKSSYMIPFACQWIVPGFVLVTCWMWPESPVWLARTGKRDAARRSLERLHGKNSSIDRDGILAQIEETLAMEKAQAHAEDHDSNNYLECFSKLHRRRTFIVMFVYTCFYLGGNTFVLGYQTYFYQLIGYSPQKSLLLGLVNTAVMWVFNVVAWCVIANVRRRPLLVWGQFGAAVCLFLIGGLSVVGSVNAYKAVVGFIFIWGFFYEISVATVGWTVGNEIPALRMRARTIGLGNIVGFVFGATTFIGFLGAFFFLPESKDRTPAEMDILFERKISVRGFHKVDITVTEDTFHRAE